MVKNASKDKKIKTTLIVLPLALMHQWKTEIESRSDLTVKIYYGKEKTKSLNELRKYSVVITTYGCMTSERPSDPVELPS